MSGGDTTAVPELSLGQLEGNLQLVMAVRAQIEKTGTVHREQMRVACESIGLELPADLPLNSYTQVPSTTNLERTKHVLTAHQEKALVNLVGSFKRNATQTWGKIQDGRFRAYPDLRPKLNHLQRVASRYDGLDVANTVDRDEPAIKAECDLISHVMDTLRNLNQLGQDSICPFTGLRREAEQVLVHINEAIATKLHFQGDAAVEQFVAMIGKFTCKVSAASYSEVENALSADGIVQAVTEAGQHYEGPIAPQVETIELDLESLSEQQVLESQLGKVLDAINEFIFYSWKVDDAFAQATNTAVETAKSLYHLKVLTA